MTNANLRFNAQFLRDLGYPIYMAVWLLARKAG